MARARNIKPGFYKNEDLAECSIWARYIFPGLWMLADREGRLEDRPKRIKGELLPFDGQDVSALLDELATRKDAQGVPFIIRYRNEDGAFIQISKFSSHQSPHYSEKPSAIKPPKPPEYGGDDARKAPREHSEGPKNPQPIKRGSQPPDSLNPDSLNPESLEETTPAVPTGTRRATGQPAAGVAPGDSTPPHNPVPPATEPDAPPTPKPGRFDASLAALRNTPPAGTPDHERAGELWAVLAANACKGTPQHPAVLEMVRAGVTPDQLRAAIAEARKSNGATLNPAYLAAIVERIRTQPPKDPSTADWATSEDAATAKGRELGINPRAGESWPEFRGRIREALANTARASVR